MISMSAEVYTSSNQFLYVKLIIDEGVYISGIKASVSISEPGQIWIQMPSYKLGNKWKRYIEISGNSEFGQRMYKTIEDVVRPKLLGKQDQSNNQARDVVVTDFDENEAIDLSDVPF